MFFTRAIVAAVLAGAAAATPASLHARDQKLTMSYCNGCIPIGEGGVSCVQNFYIHWGDNNLGSWYVHKTRGGTFLLSPPIYRVQTTLLTSVS